MVRRLRWWTIAVSLVAHASFAQTPADLQQAIRERQKSVDAADAATWDRMTSSDFTVVGPNGRLSTKAQRLAAFKFQKPQPSAARSDEHISVYGNTAVERVRIGDTWVLQVWVKQSQGWQVVATQVTTVAK